MPGVVNAKKNERQTLKNMFKNKDCEKENKHAIYIRGIATCVSLFKDMTPPRHCDRVQLQTPGS